MDRPSYRFCDRWRGAGVVRTMNCAFNSVIHLVFAVDEFRLIAFPKDVIPVHIMNIKAILERSLELFVLGLPCYDLGVSAAEITVNNDMTSVGQEQFPHIRQRS